MSITCCSAAKSHMRWGECSLSGTLVANISLHDHDTPCKASLTDWSEATCVGRPVISAQLSKCSQPMYLGM